MAEAPLFGSACVYGHVLKTRRNDRVVRVERRRRIGTAGRLKAALWESEDSETLHTSFVERLNLTIRQGSAYLRRRSPGHARGADQLHGHVDLLRGSYNVIRPHRALKFGRETRTPAMPSRLGERANERERHLHGVGRSLRIPCGGRTRSRCRPAHAHEPSRAVIVLVAARTQIGCLINSEWRKHRMSSALGSVSVRFESCTNACAGKARSRGTRCRDVIFETLFETLWVFNPIRPRSAASRNRVMRGPGVTQGAKRSQGARRPRD